MSFAEAAYEEFERLASGALRDDPIERRALVLAADVFGYADLGALTDGELARVAGHALFVGHARNGFPGSVPELFAALSATDAWPNDDLNGGELTAWRIRLGVRAIVMTLGEGVDPAGVNPVMPLVAACAEASTSSP